MAKQVPISGAVMSVHGKDGFLKNIFTWDVNHPESVQLQLSINSEHGTLEIRPREDTKTATAWMQSTWSVWTWDEKGRETCYQPAINNCITLPLMQFVKVLRDSASFSIGENSVIVMPIREACGCLKHMFTWEVILPWDTHLEFSLDVDHFTIIIRPLGDTKIAWLLNRWFLCAWNEKGPQIYYKRANGTKLIQLPLFQFVQVLQQAVSLCIGREPNPTPKLLT